MLRTSLHRSCVAALALTCVLLTGAGVSSLARAATQRSSVTAPAALPDPEADVSRGLVAQSIVFTSTPPNPATVGGSYAVTATATSTLAVTLTIDAASSAGACTITGSTVSLDGPGTCVVDANQAGDVFFDPAAQAQQTFSISPAASTDTTPTPTTTTTTTTPTIPTDPTPTPPTTSDTTPAPTTTTAASTTPAPAPATPAATPAAGSAPRMDVAPATTTTTTARAGNQTISLTFPRVRSCLAPSAKLKVAYTTAPVTGSRGAELTYVGANFTLDRRVRGVALSMTRSFQFALRGLKRGTHTLTVDSIYHEQIGRETLTVTKTIKHRFKVC